MEHNEAKEIIRKHVDMWDIEYPHIYENYIFNSWLKTKHDLQSLEKLIKSTTDQKVAEWSFNQWISG